MHENTIQETQGTLVNRLVSFEVFLPFCLTNVCAPVTVRVCFACLPGPTLPPNISFSEFQAFRLRSFLELRHGGCSVWLAHGSSLLMVFGSLAPLWCLASVPSERICPLRLMEVVHRFLPSEHFVLVLWTCGLFWHRSSRGLI